MWRPERVMQAPVSSKETGSEFLENSARVAGAVA